MSSARRQANAGFTLIEIVVALVILSISLSVLLRSFANDLHRAGQTEAETIANSLAMSLLDRLGVEQPLKDGESSGQFSNGFWWHVRIAPYGDARDRDNLTLTAHQLQAEVGWQDGTVEKSVTLATLRLAPKDPGK